MHFLRISCVCTLCLFYFKLSNLTQECQFQLHGPKVLYIFLPGHSNLLILGIYKTSCHTPQKPHGQLLFTTLIFSSLFVALASFLQFLLSQVSKGIFVLLQLEFQVFYGEEIFHSCWTVVQYFWNQKSHCFGFCPSAPRDSVFHKCRNLARLNPGLTKLPACDWHLGHIEGINLVTVNMELKMEICFEFRRTGSHFYSTLSPQRI